MLCYILNAYPAHVVRIQHLIDQVFELLIAWFSSIVGCHLVVHSPKFVEVQLGDWSVVFLICSSQPERRIPVPDYKEDDSQSKHIVCLSATLLFFEYLGRHVGRGPNFLSTCVLAFTADTKVDDFDVEFVVNSDVLWLEVSVGEPFLVQMSYPSNHLIEISSAQAIIQSAIL